MAKALRQTPSALIKLVKVSGLRGRGAAGFPSDKKWAAVHAENSATKFVVANADEGDAGAYVDRFSMEDDPFRLIEAMTIAGYAVGARYGYIYLRKEYPDALGCAIQRPLEDRFLMRRSELENKMTVLLGGPAAEDLVFAETSTGAADDLAKATEIAQGMVKRYGMERSPGQVTYEDQRLAWIERPLVAQERTYSEETASAIDRAVRTLIDHAFQSASAILSQRRDVLEGVRRSCSRKKRSPKKIWRRWSGHGSAPELLPD